MNDSSGFMGLTLTNLGLFIASALLLLAVFSLVASSDWQRTEELHAIARDISARIQDMDATFFEHSLLYQCPQKKYDYTITISAEYISVSTKNSLGVPITVKERFIVRPWLRNLTMNWTTGNQLHKFLNTTYGHLGTPHDPLPANVLTTLKKDQEEIGVFLALHPVSFRPDTPFSFEKVILVDDNDEHYTCVLLYQIK